MKIGILGTRGIPNNYGGFEQAAEFLSRGLAEYGHQVTVYNPHNHPYQEKRLGNVDIVHCHDPEYRIGTAGQFIYDLNCLRDASRRKFDCLLIMGYTSSSVWWRIFPEETTVIFHMDGLEWKRSKYSPAVRRFLRYAEKLAVKHGHFHIADSPAIAAYLENKYGIHARYIPYGAAGSPAELHDMTGLEAGSYYMLMARMEPENHIDMILQGFCETNTICRFVVTGDTATRYGREMQSRYGRDERIIFTGAEYNQHLVRSLRRNCRIYFHGHSVGGTNPSLLEAMESGISIAAHRNIFNRYVLEENAFFFSDANEVRELISTFPCGRDTDLMIRRNRERITREYSWERVTAAYHDLIISCSNTRQIEKTVHQRYTYQ